MGCTLCYTYKFYCEMPARQSPDLFSLCLLRVRSDGNWGHRTPNRANGAPMIMVDHLTMGPILQDRHLGSDTCGMWSYELAQNDDPSEKTILHFSILDELLRILWLGEIRCVWILFGHPFLELFATKEAQAAAIGQSGYQAWGLRWVQHNLGNDMIRCCWMCI